jgi:hypothetical protein
MEEGMNQDAFARIAESLRQYQMGCLDECPAKIPVAIFAIAMTFTFAI